MSGDRDTTARPRVGRDPNDATWRIVRYAADWDAAALDGLVFAPSRGTESGALELAPVASEVIDDRTLARPVTDAGGVVWQADPRRHLLLRRGPCEDELSPVVGVGGRGWQTGELSRPLGVAVDDRGLVYVADADNHRVQVLRVERVAGRAGDVWRADVAVVLGASDGSGRPVAGQSCGAMLEPVAVAVAPGGCGVYVADRAAGRVHVFDGRFRWVHSFAPGPDLPRPEGTAPMPVAVAATGTAPGTAAGPAHTLYIWDASWPHVLRAGADGALLATERRGVDGDGELADAAYLGDAGETFATLARLRRFQPVGEAVIGPLDGGIHDLAWHRILVDVTAPAGTRVEVQSYAANDAAAVPPGASATIPWAPAAPVPIPGPDAIGLSESRTAWTARGHEHDRLVLSDTGRWARIQRSPHARARPILARYTGDGPNAADAITLPAAALRLVRAGDGIELAGAAGSEPARLDVLPPLAVRLSYTGVARVYPAGSRVSLAARDGAPIAGGPRLLHELVMGEAIDLTALAALSPGSIAAVELPHAAAAPLRPGDVAVVQVGADAARLEVGAVELTDRAVSLDGALTGDFRAGTVRLTDTPGRLLVAEGAGFEHPPPAREPITVRAEAGAVTARIHLAEPDLADADREPVTALWLEPGPLDAPGGPVTFETWTALEALAPPDLAIHTDRGRYLWIRLRLHGADLVRGPDGDLARVTPAVHSVRALMPRLAYTEYLPELFRRRDDRRDPAGAIFLDRFLALFEGALTGIEQAYDSLSRLLDPAAADDEWLAFVAGWLDLVFDPSWPIERRRALVMEAAELYRRRGTPASLRRYIEIYTGRRPELIEAFQARPVGSAVVGGWCGGAVLGTMPLGRGRPGADDRAADDTSGADDAHRFTLFVYLDRARDREVAEGAVRAIVAQAAPAHTEWTLRFVLPDARVGVQSTVGLDLVLGAPATDCTILGQGSERPVLGRDPGGVRLGDGVRVGARLVTAASAGHAGDGARLGPGGARLDQSFALE